MAADELRFKVSVDGADAAAKDVAKVQKAADKLEGNTTTIEVEAEDKASKPLDAVAKKAEALSGENVEITVDAKVDALLRSFDEVAAEAKKAAAAADALGQALGPELAAKADTRGIVSELQNAGLTLDDITANADELGAKLKELSDADVGGKMGSSLGTARGKLDEMTDSARGANSALANVVGNSAQDLAALGGVAGTAGVALGQIGEYAADATLGGESLGSALTSMAKVAGPMAALSLAVQLVGTYMEGIKVEDAFRSELVDEFTDSIRETGSAITSMNEKFTDTGKIEFVESGTGFLGLSKSVKDLVPIAAEYGVTVQQFTDNSQKGADAQEQFALAVTGATALYGDGAKSKAARNLIEALDQYGKSTKTAAADVESFNAVNKVTTESAVAAYDAYVKLQDPVGQFPAEFARMADAMAHGMNPAAKDLETTTEGLGLSLGEVIALAGGVTKRTEETRSAFADASTSLGTFTDNLALHVIEIGKASDEMADLGSTLDVVGLRQDVLANVFKLDEGPRNARDELRTITEGIDGLSEAAKGVKVGDALANDIKADKLLDAIDQLAPQIQSAVTTAFGSGGPEAATAMANSYIDQVTAELDGKFTREQVAEMLGLSNIEATIAVAVEQSDIESAKRQLAILVGVGGQTPYTAQIALALDAGTITGAQAQTLIQSKLGDAGVAIPSTLAQPQTAEGMAAAQAALDAGVPVAVPSKVDTTNAKTDVDTFVADDHGTVVLPSEADKGALSTTDKAINAVADANRTAWLMSQADGGTLGATDAAIDGVAEANRTAWLMSQAEPGTLAATDSDLEGVKSRARTAEINTRADAGDLSSTGRAIDAVANKPRTATIYVKTTATGVQLGNWTGPGADTTSAMAPTVTGEETTTVAPNGRMMRVTRRPTTRRQPVANVTNVTNNVIVPRIPSGRELERVSQRWARANGRG